MEYGEKAVINAHKQGSDTNIFATIMREAEKGEELDDHDVRLEATALIVAGSDTTAITLAYLVWAVLCHPHVQRQLQAEVASLPSNFIEDDLEQLPYLNAVIEETLRLYGAAPGSLPRVVPQGGATLGGYLIPEDTIVSTQAYTTHRIPEIFPDPYR